MHNPNHDPMDLAPPAFEGSCLGSEGAFPVLLSHAPPGYDPEAVSLRETNLDHLELPAPVVPSDLTALEDGPFLAVSPMSASRLDALSLALPAFEATSHPHKIV